MDINVNVTVDAGPRIAPVLELVAGTLRRYEEESRQLADVAGRVGEVLSRYNEREAQEAQEAPQEAAKAASEAPKRKGRKKETAAEPEAAEAPEKPSIEVVVLPDAAPAAEPAQAPAPEPAQAAAPAEGADPEPIDAETLRAQIVDRVNVLVKRNQSPSVRALLTRYNKGRVSELAEDQLGAFLSDLQKIGE